MEKAHVIKLVVTKEQEAFFKKSCGVARFSFNWGLNKWKEDYKNGIKQSAYLLIKHLNSIKKEQFPWMGETGKCASQYAIHDLEFAYKQMWVKKAGYPKFKKKGFRDSFVAVESHRSFKQENNRMWIPRLGWVKCCEYLRFKGRVNHVVVKRIADMWFAVVNISIEGSSLDAPTVRENQTNIGVDMGIKRMMVLSDGAVFENPKALKSNLKSLKRLHRGLDRKQDGSSNKRKQQVRLARKYYRVSCIRKNAIHQATSAIVKKYDRIVIETLKPRNMVKNHVLAQAVGDVSFGEIARQLAYKSLWAEKELIKANQWFPSSKLCSCCGYKKETLKLSERTYHCENCGMAMDRDLNAAKNLARYSPTSEFEESEACGDGLVARQRTSEKQELNVINQQSKHLKTWAN